MALGDDDDIPAAQRIGHRSGGTQRLNRQNAVPEEAGERPERGEPVNRDWRSARPGTRPSPRPAVGRSRDGNIILWLQRGGWQIVLGAFGVLVAIALLAILFSPPSSTSRATPTAVPDFQSPIIPTAVIAPQVVASPVPRPTGRFRVNGTGVEGLFLRAEPSRESTILKTFPEGTELTATGEDRQAGDLTWRRVRDGDGVEGWVAAQFLAPAE